MEKLLNLIGKAMEMNKKEEVIEISVKYSGLWDFTDFEFRNTEEGKTIGITYYEYNPLQTYIHENSTNKAIDIVTDNLELIDKLLDKSLAEFDKILKLETPYEVKKYVLDLLKGE